MIVTVKNRYSVVQLQCGSIEVFLLTMRCCTYSPFSNEYALCMQHNKNNMDIPGCQGFFLNEPKKILSYHVFKEFLQ